MPSDPILIYHKTGIFFGTAETSDIRCQDLILFCCGHNQPESGGV